MLPDFPRAKKAVHQYFFGEIGERRSQGPLLDLVRNITVYEGNDTQPIEARFEVRGEDLIRDVEWTPRLENAFSGFECMVS